MILSLAVSPQLLLQDVLSVSEENNDQSQEDN